MQISSQLIKQLRANFTRCKPTLTGGHKGHLQIPRDISERLKEQLLQIRSTPYDTAQFESFLDAARHAILKVLPDCVQADVRHNMEKDPGYVVLSGLPTDDDLPNTPLKGGSLEPGHKNTFLSEALLVGVSALLGTKNSPLHPYNFRQEGFGDSFVIDNVVPIKALRLQKGAGGFSEGFGFHTESAYHRLSPDALCLKGVRADHELQAKTLLAPLSIIIPQLAPDLIKRLERPIYTFHPPQLYRTMERQGIPFGTASTFTGPILKYQEGRYTINLNMNGTTTLDDDAKLALDTLDRVLHNFAIELSLGPGDLLLVNNRLCAHTRSGYTPRFDGKDRWFHRVNMTHSLWNQTPVTVDGLSKFLKLCPSESQVIFSDLQTCGFLSDSGKLTLAFADADEAFRKALVQKRCLLPEGHKTDSEVLSPEFLSVSPLTRAHLRPLHEYLLRHGPVPPRRIV